MQQTTIPVTVDKSHLTTIGTRLYAESLDLVRELVANAYDADAATVKIALTESELTVEDDGSGTASAAGKTVSRHAQRNKNSAACHARPEKIEQAYEWQSRLLTDALVEKKES